MSSFIKKAYRPPVLAGFGNVLLDVHVTGLGDDFLKRFNLELDGLKEVPKEDFFQIASAVPETNIMCRIPGGSAQNTVRIAQWLIGAPAYAVIFGGIGRDEGGKQLEEMVKSCGVQTRYAYNDDLPTGTAYCFGNGENRSCVACLGASSVYRLADLDKDCNWEILKEVLFVYVEGFFITHSFSTAQKLTEFCDVHGTAFCINLSASYVCDNYSSELVELIKHASIVFGNKLEYEKLARALKWPTRDVLEIVKKVRGLALQGWHTKHKNEQLPVLLKTGPIVVATQANNPVIAFEGTMEVPHEFAVPPLDVSSIKDTTGAGDAFVAGFVSAALADFDLEMCVRVACWTARQVLGQVGAGLPTDTSGLPQDTHGLFLPFAVGNSTLV